MATILIAEDDHAISDLVAYNLNVRAIRPWRPMTV